MKTRTHGFYYSSRTMHQFSRFRFVFVLHSLRCYGVFIWILSGLAFDFYPRASAPALQRHSPPPPTPSSVFLKPEGRSKRKENLRNFFEIRRVTIFSRFRESPLPDGHSRKRERERERGRKNGNNGREEARARNG